MKTAKTIDVKLNGLYDARFTLEFAEDEHGNEYGILTVPYVKWFSPDENDIWERVYEISGELLECIEKQYFDNNVVIIPVKGYPIPVEMEDILQKIAPEKICNQMINGTYKIADDADKSIYGNMPARSNTKPVNAGKQPKAKLIKNPSFDADKEAIKKIIPEIDQIIDGTYDFNANAGKSKHGNKPKKAKK